MKFIKHTIPFLAVLLLIGNSSYGQRSKANSLYNNLEYMRAIPLYLKLAKKGDKEAIHRLANSYRLTKDYLQAEMWYSKAVALEPVEPVIHYEYGEVLKTNGKYDEAKQQFQKFEAALPGNPKALTQIKSCDLIKEWNQLPPTFEVNNLSGINGSMSDFSAVPFKAGLVFVSERKTDLLDNETYGWNDRPYLSVFYTEKKSKDSSSFETPVVFSKKINTDYHNGPVCFNKEQNLVYFTRVDKLNKKEAGFVNRPKIYIASFDKEKATQIQSFFLNSDAYSVAHPSISQDGNTLYFASDMPGGIGGMDIYYCVKQGESWSNPVNLGPEVNTLDNEVFPFIGLDNTLYFSSAGHPGYGGLDVHSANFENGKWTNIRNLYAPLNSSYDDFGIYLNNRGEGYVSSNRSGGVGDDDIYTARQLNATLITSIAGTLMSNEIDPAADMAVKLLNSKGEVVQTGKTNALGEFEFKNLDADEVYVVMLEEDDVNLKTDLANSNMYGKITYNGGEPGSKARLVIMNNERVVVRELSANEKGYFKFNKLAYDYQDFEKLEEMDDTQLSVLKVSTLSGTFMKNDQDPADSITVNLVNSKGEIVQQTKTTAGGDFKFTKLNPDENYIVMLDAEETGINADASNFYGRFKYNNDMPGSKVKIEFRNKDNTIAKAMVADKKGFFNYNELPVDERYLSLLDEEDTQLAPSVINSISGKLQKGQGAAVANQDVVLLDSKGNVVKRGKTDSDGNFKFEKLSADENYVVMLESDETSLDAGVYGRITYNEGDAGSRAKLVVKGKNETKELVADKKGFFNYQNLPADEKYLTLLDEEDADMHLSNTISIVGKVLIGDKLDSAATGLKVHLTTKDGKKVKTVVSDKQGIFRFVNLLGSEDYVVTVDEDDPMIKASFKHVILGKILRSGQPDDPASNHFIALGGGTGIVLKTTNTDVEGYFKFETLSSEMASLSQFGDENTSLVTNRKLSLSDKDMLYFNYAKYAITQESASKLDELVKTLKESPSSSVIFKGHTDSMSNYGHNMYLSGMRAKAAANYIIQKGIEAGRVKTKRFGETTPVNKCKEGVPCTEDEHKLNRRVEIEIIKG